MVMVKHYTSSTACVVFNHNHPHVIMLTLYNNHTSMIVVKGEHDDMRMKMKECQTTVTK